MKRIEKLVWCLSILGVLFSVSAPLVFKAQAQQAYQKAQRIERGRYGGTYLVSGSSVAGTALISPNVMRPDGLCRNNGSTTIWIGTVTATQHNTIHDNVRTGIFLKSSDTFTLDGSFTGEWDMTCDTGVSACEMRCAEGLTRQD